MMIHSASAITAPFQSILDILSAPLQTPIVADTDAERAIEQVQSVFLETILPRRISLRSGDGGRLSVVVKNRRIIAVTDVHPENLWTGTDTPEQAECVAEFDSFGAPLTATLLALTERGDIEIDRHFVIDALPDTVTTGYPASKLFDHFAFAKRGGNSQEVIAFFDAFPDNARARFGADTVIDVPSVSSIDEKWIADRVDEYRDVISNCRTDARVVLRNGERPIAMACVSVHRAGCIVVSEDPDLFDDLLARVAALHVAQQN